MKLNELALYNNLKKYEFVLRVRIQEKARGVHYKCPKSKSRINDQEKKKYRIRYTIIEASGEIYYC